jgi:hypothetical protein
MHKKLFLFSLIFILGNTLLAQKRSLIIGQILDKKTNQAIVGANITIVKDNTFVLSDENGKFTLETKPDLHNLKISMLGYASVILHEIETTSSQPVKIEVLLEQESTQLSETVCQSTAYSRNNESPTSLFKFNQFEVLRLPGATMDISKYIKSLPGVSPRVSFGYNMIVRGGASFENKYYLDGIEIPTITHFNVAGTSGGPNGWINTKMLSSAVLHSGAFPSNRPNALSSVLELSQREGRTDRFGGNFTIGPSEWGFLLEGRMGKKSSYIFSARESYAQHALKAIGVPVIPTFSDVSYAQTVHFDDKNTLKIVALGLYDKYELNYGADTTETRLYNIGFIPEGKQFAYVLGLNYKKIKEDGYSEWILSRNGFFNNAKKYSGNSKDEVDLTLDFKGKEVENKFRYENKTFFDRFALTYGANAELDQVRNQNQSYYFGQNSKYGNFYDTKKNIIRFGLFATTNGKILDEKMDWSASLRTDGNNYNKEMGKVFNHLSPRLSASYNVNNLFRINANAGIYYQMPTYGVLLFPNNIAPQNIENFKYIRSNQVALGIEHNTATIFS